MGDTGSLILGIVISCLAIKFIEEKMILDSANENTSAAAIAIGILVVPLFDTLRVFSVRIAEKKSPFEPDKRHIHHRLLDLGLNHIESTIVLVIVNIMFIVIAFAFHKLGTMMLTAILFGLAIVFFIPASLYYKKEEKIPLKRIVMNKIKFAIIGYGHIGRRHCAMVSGNEETELVAVADVNPERIDLAKEEQDVPVFESIDDLLAADIEIDVVNICTPNGLHGKQSIKALEKKMSCSCREAMALGEVNVKDYI